MNHHLELAVKDAFSGSYFDEVTSVLVALHSVYQHIPKRLRELRDLAEIMEERIRNLTGLKVQDGHSTSHVHFYLAMKSYSYSLTGNGI